MNKPYNRNFQRKRDLHKINRFISNENVRVILEDGEQLGVMTTKDAIELAQSRGVDLVEIAPNNDPPVCKIIDYGKFKYQEQKKKNEAKKKQKVMETKEVKIRPGTGDHDYDVKLRNARKFISEGNNLVLGLKEEKWSTQT